MVPTVGGVTLEQAQELVRLLENQQQVEAERLLHEIAGINQDELFESIGKLTRQLHNSIQDFLQDPRLSTLTTDELPDAQNRLEYVIQRTEDAANRTMDAVEASLPLAEEMAAQVQEIQPLWANLMNRNLDLKQFKGLCHQVNGFLQQSGTRSEHLHNLLTEVLMAQDFQDLTGQVIRRVIELVQEVEGQLISLLTIFGEDYYQKSGQKAEKRQTTASNKSKNGAEGPIINPEERDDVVQGQDDVDDLLSSLGF